MTKAATKPATSTIKNVHEAIVHVMNQVGYVQKQDASGLPYSFASEAAFIKAIRPHMVEVGLTIVQNDVEEILLQSYETKKGTIAFSRVFRFAFKITHAPSETFEIVTAIGEGTDYGDKGSNKAMTIALKYALRQTLLIETGDDPDETSSDLFEQAKKLGGTVWTDGHINAVKITNPDATNEQYLNALNMFAEVAGWDTKTSPSQYQRLAELHQKAKAISEQDGEPNPGFRELTNRAFEEYQTEI